MSTTRIARGALKIPNYIARGPTDILKALSSTVKFLPENPPHYLQDDPYLLPNRKLDFKTYPDAKLNGIKTAKFILNKYPELFYRDDAEPKVDQFLPREKFEDDMEFTEDDIRWCIENNDPMNGVIAYQKLKSNGIELGQETLMQFFELLCYTNGDNPMDLNQLESERLYFNELEQYTWKHSGVAEKFFEEFEDRLEPARLYSALIAGLSKFNACEKAKEKFEDFMLKHPDKGLLREAYAGLLHSIARTSSSVSALEEGISMVTNHMANHNVIPDLIMFNTILRAFSRSSIERITSETIFKLINDMVSLQIQPSLCTYESMIITIVRSGFMKDKITLVNDILNYIIANEKIQEIRDLRDVYFCRNIMFTITRNMHDFKLASKLFKLFMTNPSLIPMTNHKQQLMDQYLRLMITTCPIEETMDFYKKFVGRHFVPNDQSYDALIEALDLYRPDKEVIKIVWSDILKFDLHSKLKNDSLFKEDPEYIEALNRHLDRKALRESKRR